MKASTRIVGYAALVALSIGAYVGYRLAFGRPFTLNQLANRQALLYLRADPETLTEVGIIDGTIFDRHSGKLTGVGPPRLSEEYAMAEKFAAEVRQFDRSKLNPQEQITYDLLIDQYSTVLSFRRFGWLTSEGAAAMGPGLYPIAPMWGTQAALPEFLETETKISNQKTARNYLRRLDAAGGKFDEVTKEMLRQAQLGVILPTALLDKAQAGIRETLSPSPADNPLVSTFVDRMTRAKGIDRPLQSQLAVRAADAVANGIYPALTRMSAALDAQKPAAADRSAGVGSLPDGSAYYAAALRQMTTTDDTPEEIHALGLAEVARIDAEMDANLRRLGLARGTVAERMQALHKDARFLLPNTDEGRQQLLSKYREILDHVALLMPQYFNDIPAQKIVVQRLPVASEKGAASARYLPAAEDGSRPGVFAVNLRDVAETATWTMKTLAYHEGIPGHHFQISIAQNLKDLPFVRQQTLYSAYSEGWALYAENLAADIGLYKDDPLGDIGRLEAEMFRSARLVVDTGLHASGWTRDQAVAYMVNTTGMNESEVVSEVERYMGLPGQACAYKVGELKILALRERAKAALGSRFDLKEFHGVILENGALPLTIVETLVDEWRSKRKS